MGTVKSNIINLIKKKVDFDLFSESENRVEYLYELFLKYEMDDYHKNMGYGKKEIEDIGSHKFIEFMGIESPGDLSRWRTNVVNVVICPDCNSDFAFFQIDYGLCKECINNYDRKKFENYIQTKMVETKDLMAQYDVISAFFLNTDFRNIFRKR